MQGRFINVPILKLLFLCHLYSFDINLSLHAFHFIGFFFFFLGAFFFTFLFLQQVTASGCKNMTKCPRKIWEIEAVMAGEPWPLDKTL